VDITIATTIIQQRAGPDGIDGTEDDTPFRSVNQLATAGLSAQATQQLGRYCTVRSSTFDVQVTAKIGDSTRIFHAIVYRNTGIDIQVLGFYWE
jgi:Type II secretion system (T2SS), protein K